MLCLPLYSTSTSGLSRLPTFNFGDNVFGETLDGGDDKIKSDKGNDINVGDKGNDKINAGQGDDVLDGGDAVKFQCGSGDDDVTDFDESEGDKATGNCEGVEKGNSKK